MPRAKPWLKMWTEWVDDNKMLRLSLAEQGAWWRVVTLAQKCNTDGKLVTGGGSPLSLDEIADSVHIKNNDMPIFQSMLAKMEREKSFHWEGDILVVTHFAERQSQVPSETPEAMRERQRRHREQKRTSQQFRDAPLTTPSSTRKHEDEEERRGECHGEKSVTPQSIPKLESRNIRDNTTGKPKKPYGEFGNVLLTTDEYQKLREKFGAGLEDRIEALSTGIASKGYRYKSHYATILNWERMERRGGRHPATNSRHLETAEELKKSWGQK